MTHLATFDLALDENVRFYGMRLLRSPDGGHVTYAPTAIGGRRSATFARSLAEAITKQALTIYSEHVTANGATSQIQRSN
ncbi:MAG: hypothetical protein EOP12_01255 [Pseudomonas sp.]|nr:MAG: hypothetical protein EOP12_01255 [Pseudomonas sp.]